MTINLNTQENCSFVLFPDNQPHVKIEEDQNTDIIHVVCSLTGPNKLLQLGMVKDIIDYMYKAEKILHIPYLLGARYDRRMDELESFDLKVIASIINSFKFDVVFLYDPHSDVAPALIERSYVRTNQVLVEAYKEEYACLIIPDAGAAKKAPNYFKWNGNIVDSVQCAKHRDLKTGAISLEVLKPEECRDRNCVIIDDICDGGATFIAIAEKLPEIKSLTLIVTHGIFSKGFEKLEEHFDHIITSNSRFTIYNSNKVKIIDYDF